jgi:hypothetical protein
MDSLIFGLIAVRNLYNRQEPVRAETEAFQPLDIQSLRYVYGTAERAAHQSIDRNDSHLAQAVS